MSYNNISVIVERDVLLERLKAKRIDAEKYDADALAKHKVQATKFAKTIRAELARAAALDDEPLCTWVAAISNTYERREIWDKAPQCPLSQMVAFDDAIERIELDKRTSFNLDHNGLAYLLKLLQWSPKKKDRVC